MIAVLEYGPSTAAIYGCWDDDRAISANVCKSRRSFIIILSDLTYAEGEAAIQALNCVGWTTRLVFIDADGGWNDNLNLFLNKGKTRTWYSCAAWRVSL